MATTFTIESDVYDTEPKSWAGAPREESYRSISQAEMDIDRICSDYANRNPGQYEIHGSDGSRYTWSGEEDGYEYVRGTADDDQPAAAAPMPATMTRKKKTGERRLYHFIMSRSPASPQFSMLSAPTIARPCSM